MSRELTAAGFTVLRFDFSGLGGSQGNFTDSNLSSNTTDLIDAVRFLEREHEAPALLIGHSMGGVAVLNVAAALSSVSAVATIATPAEASHLGTKLARARDTAQRRGDASIAIGGQTFTLKRQFFDDLEAFSARTGATELGKPLLVLHSPRDTTVEISNASTIFRAARHPKSFVSLGTADHLLLKEEDARYAGRVIAAWASRYV